MGKQPPFPTPQPLAGLLAHLLRALLRAGAAHLPPNPAWRWARRAPAEMRVTQVIAPIRCPSSLGPSPRARALVWAVEAAGGSARLLRCPGFLPRPAARRHRGRGSVADGFGARGPLCAGMLASKLGMQGAGECGSTGKSSASCSKTSTALSVVLREAGAAACTRSRSWGDLGAQVPAISVSVRFPNTFVDLAKRA